MKKRIWICLVLAILFVCLIGVLAGCNPDEKPEETTAPLAGKFINDSGYWLDSNTYVITHTLEYFSNGTAQMQISGILVSEGEPCNFTLNGTYSWKKGDNIVSCVWTEPTVVEYLYTGTEINTGYAVLRCVGWNSLGEFEGIYNLVSYGTSGPGNIEGEVMQYITDGESAQTVTAVPSLGAEFVRWSDGVLTPTRTDDSVSGNISVFAEFRRVTDVFSLYYSAGTGGTIQGETTQEVLVNGSGTEVTAVPDEGYGFIKWSDGVTTATRTDTNITQHLSVTAEFGRKITLSYSAGEGGTVQGETTQELIEGTAGTSVTAVSNEGWYFVSWTDGVDTPTRTDTPSYHGNSTVSFKATFAPYHTVKYIVYGEGGTIQGDTTQLVKPEETPTAVTAVPDEGYKLKGWYEDSVSDGNLLVAAGETFSGGPIWYYGDGTTTYYVAFEPIEYICTYYAATGGTVNGSVNRCDSIATVLTGYATAEILAVPESGYVFTGWSDGRTDNPRVDIIDPDNPQPVTVTARFARGYTLTYTAGAGGTIEGEAVQSVLGGNSGTAVTAVPNEGYAFVRWSDGVATVTRMDTDVAGNISVTAEFEIDPDYTPFAGGDGSVENPYMIDSLSRLRMMSLYPSAHFVLTADIVLPEVSEGANNFTPLFSDEKPFLGTLDGAGHKIINLTVYNTETFYSGLFSVIGSTGSVKNLTLENALMSGTNYVGIIAGWSLGSITDCTVSGVVTHIAANGYKVFVGGIAGRAEGNIDGCSAAVNLTVTDAEAATYAGGIAGYLSFNGSSSSPLTLTASGTVNIVVAGSAYAGGLVGYNYYNITITDSYATGNVTASSDSYETYAGGLIGYNDDSITITDSYATGNVTASGDYYETHTHAGGLIGYNDNSITITDSYATGNVTASGSSSAYAGGLVGYNRIGTTITDSYATGDVTASGSSSACAGGLIGDDSNTTVRNAYSSSMVSAEGGGTVYAGGLAGYVGNVSLENAHWLKSADTDAAYAVGYSDSLGVPTSIGSTSHAILDEFYTLADTLNAGREVPVWEHTGENTLPSLIIGGDESA